MVLNNQQVYHTSKTTIDLDVNTYLTIDPKVRMLHVVWPMAEVTCAQTEVSRLED